MFGGFMSKHRSRGIVAAATIAALSLLAAACGSDSSDDAKSGSEATTTTIEEETTTSLDTSESTDTTTVTGAEETTSTTFDTGTTLPGGTPTTSRRTTTTVRRSGGGTATTVKSGGGGATTTTAKSSTQAKGTIKMGLIGSEVNSRGQVQGTEGKQIAEAWIAATNAAGGINGYKFQLVYRNANGDSARALAAAKEMKAAGVVAFTEADASFMPSIADYMAQNNLPVLGGQPYTIEFDYHPMFFPVQAGQFAGVYGQVAAARDVGAKHFRNVYCAEVAACATAVPETRYAAEREGLKFSSQAASAVAPDYTATCLAAKADGADFFQSNGLNFANVVRDCSRQNYHPTYAVGGAANQGVIDGAKGENVAGNLFEWGVFYDGPEVQRFRQALAKTDYKVSDGTASQTSVHVWLAMEMLGAIAEKMTAANPTNQDFLSAAYTIKGETLNGQIAPMDYTVQKPGTGKHAASDCWTEHTVKEGKFVHMNKSGQAVNRLTFICGTGVTYVSGSPPKF
jgi:branched-chain amino acid transport system substrate-binding protein